MNGTLGVWIQQTMDVRMRDSLDRRVVRSLMLPDRLICGHASPCHHRPIQETRESGAQASPPSIKTHQMTEHVEIRSRFLTPWISACTLTQILFAQPRGRSPLPTLDEVSWADGDQCSDSPHCAHRLRVKSIEVGRRSFLPPIRLSTWGRASLLRERQYLGREMIGMDCSGRGRCEARTG
jgi:hypothetical protein